MIYTAWPIAADVTARLVSAGVTPRASGQAAVDRAQSALDAVIAEVARVTRRQFVCDQAPVRRLFDGTGTAEEEIDELVEFVSAAALGYQSWPGFDLANIVAVHEQGLPCSRLIRGQGSVPAWPTEAALVPIPAVFPAGRRNIAVTARWGYAETIPADLWDAVLCGATLRLAREATLSQDASGGIIAEWQEGDERTRYAPDGAKALGWADAFDCAVARYKRSTGRRARNLHARMV